MVRNNMKNKVISRLIDIEEYEKMLENAEWYSVIQSSDFSRAMLVQIDGQKVLAYNYEISNNIAIIFITCYNKKLLSMSLEYAISRMLELNKEITGIITYLLDKSECEYLENETYKFEQIGRYKKGIVYYEEIKELLVYHAKSSE